MLNHFDLLKPFFFFFVDNKLTSRVGLSDRVYERRLVDVEEQMMI